MRRDRAPDAGCARGRSGWTARDRVVRAAVAGVPLRELAGSAATPGLRRRRRASCSPSSSAPASTPARFTARCATWAGAGPRAAYAGELGALYSAYRRAAGGARAARSREGYAWAVLDALRADPAVVGRAARLPLRLRRPHADGARRRRDARATTPRPTSASRCPYEPGRVAFAGRAATVEELRPLAAEVVHLPERSEHYAPSARRALHHLERSLFEPRARPAAAERRRPAARGRRRARGGGARRRRGARADAPGDRPRRTSRCCCAATRAPPRCSPRCSPATGSRSPTTGASRSGARGSAPACSPARGRRSSGGTAADLLTWLRTPGRLADPERRRPARGAGAPQRDRAARGRRARVWEARLGRPAADRARRLAAAAAEGAEALLARDRGRGAGDLDGAAPPPRARCSRPRTSPTPASPRDLRSAAPSCASSPPPTRACSAMPLDVLDGARAGPGAASRPRCRAREPRRAARRSARDPRPPLPRGLRLRAAGRRVPAPAGARAVPLRRRPARARGRDRPAPAARTRTCSTASARSSTPRSRGRRTCCSSPGAPRTRRATRAAPSVVPGRRPRAVHRRRCGTERGTRLLADVTWAPRDAPTPHELRRAYAAARTEPDPAPLGAPETDAAAGAARPRARPSRPAAWRRSPPAACAG